MLRLDSGQPVEHDPLVERVDERNQRLERHVECELVADGRKGFAQDGTPLRVHVHEPLAELGPVPGQGLQLEPDLLVRTILVEIGHRRPPLLDKRHVRRVHLPLPLDQPLGEALEHPDEQLLHRPEVVVDEAVIRAGLVGHAPRRDPGRAHLDQEPLGGIEERLLGLVAWASLCLRHST